MLLLNQNEIKSIQSSTVKVILINQILKIPINHIKELKHQSFYLKTKSQNMSKNKIKKTHNNLKKSIIQIKQIKCLIDAHRQKKKNEISNNKPL